MQVSHTSTDFAASSADALRLVTALYVKLIANQHYYNLSISTYVGMPSQDILLEKVTIDEKSKIG